MCFGNHVCDLHRSCCAVCGMTEVEMLETPDGLTCRGIRPPAPLVDEPTPLRHSSALSSRAAPVGLLTRTAHRRG